MENQMAYENAKKRLQEKMGFKIHLIVYVVIISFLAVINYMTSSGYLWFLWPAMGWGIGLLFHALNTYVFQDKFSITEEMIRKEMEKNQ